MTDALPMPDTDVDVEGLIYRPGVYLVTITPAVAKRLLERNTNNRKPKETAIARYVNDMVRGKWRISNQGIGFDRNGVLSDGQNRLIACMESNKPFTTVMLTGLEPEARDVVDVGVKRSFADVLRMEGKVNVMPIAAGTSLRLRYNRLVGEGRPWSQSIPRALVGNHEDMLAYVLATPALESRASAAWLVRKAFPRVPMSAIVAFESMAEEVDHEALTDFRNALVTGANLEEGDPRLVLRNYLMRMEGTRRGGPQPMLILGLFIKSWNDWRSGEKRELLILRDNEPMPAIETPSTRSARRRRQTAKQKQAVEAAQVELPAATA